MAYTQDFKAKAVALVKASGYPNRAGAIGDVARQTGVSRQVLYNWLAAAGDAPGPAPEVLQAAELDLAAAVRSELTAVFAAMNTTRERATYRELASAAGLLIDKLQLLQGQPTSRVETISTLLDRLSPEEYAAIVAEAEDILRTATEDDGDDDTDSRGGWHYGPPSQS